METKEYKITYVLNNGTRKSKIVDKSEFDKDLKKLKKSKLVKYYWYETVFKRFNSKAA